MIVRIRQAISAQSAQTLCERVRTGPTEEGSRTARGATRNIKNNLQMVAGSPQARESGQQLIAEIREHPLFKSVAFPAQISPPNFSRYLPGMTYGRHVDAALMNAISRQSMRTDLSVTVFLAPADSYEGGELVIDTGSAREVCKGGPGDCVVYPASYYHWIEPVRSGERIVSYFWLQSMIRSEERRRLAFDLSRILVTVSETGDPHNIMLPLSKVYSNLLREFAEP